MSGSAEDRPDLGERFESARGATPLPTVALGMQLALSSTGLLEQRIWGSASRTQILRRFGLLAHSLAALPHSSITAALDHGQHLQTIFVDTVIDDIGEAPQSRRTHVPPDDAMYLGHT